MIHAMPLKISDVVLEIKVLVSRRLEDKKIKSWSWSLGNICLDLGLGLDKKSLENFQDLWV